MRVRSFCNPETEGLGTTEWEGGGEERVATQCPTNAPAPAWFVPPLRDILLH